MPSSPFVRSEATVSDSESEDRRSVGSQGDGDSASVDSENESDIDRELQDEQDDWLVEDEEEEEEGGDGDLRQGRLKAHSHEKDGKRKKKSKRRKHQRPSHPSDDSDPDLPRSLSQDNDNDDLDEDDLELLRENTGMSIPSREEANPFKRLKRGRHSEREELEEDLANLQDDIPVSRDTDRYHGHDSTSYDQDDDMDGPSGSRDLERLLFDEEEADDDRGGATRDGRSSGLPGTSKGADSAGKMGHRGLGGERNGGLYEEDVDDFIDYDEDEEGELADEEVDGRQIPTQRSTAPASSRPRARPSGVDGETEMEIGYLFNDGLADEYAWAMDEEEEEEGGGEEEDEHEAEEESGSGTSAQGALADSDRTSLTPSRATPPSRGTPSLPSTLAAVFEPAILAERMLTTQDEEIRIRDEPERRQQQYQYTRQSVLGPSSQAPVAEDAGEEETPTEEELDREVEYIARELLPWLSRWDNEGRLGVKIEGQDGTGPYGASLEEDGDRAKQRRLLAREEGGGDVDVLEERRRRAIREAVKFLRTERLEVPALDLLRKDYFEDWTEQYRPHPQAPLPTRVLGRPDLWEIARWDRGWRGVEAQVRRARQMIQRLWEWQDGRDPSQGEEDDHTSSFSASNQHSQEDSEEDGEALKYAARRLDQVTGSEDVGDILQLLRMRFGKELSVRSSSSSSSSRSLPASQVDKRAGGGGAWDMVRSIGAMRHFLRLFGITAREFGENLRDGVRHHWADDATEDPQAAAQEVIRRMASTPSSNKQLGNRAIFKDPVRVVETGRGVIAELLASDPLVRMAVRETLKGQARVSIHLTDRGSQVIDASHPVYPFKYVRNKAESAFIDGQFLQMCKAETDGLLRVEVIYPSALTDGLIQRAVSLYIGDGYSEAAERWNRERAAAVRRAFEDRLIPDTTRWARGKLRAKAEAWVGRRIYLEARSKLSSAPYRRVPTDPTLRTGDPRSIPRILSLSWGEGRRNRDGVEAIILGGDGRIRAHAAFPDLRDHVHQLSFISLMRQHTPDLVLISGFGVSTRRLLDQVRQLVQAEFPTMLAQAYEERQTRKSKLLGEPNQNQGQSQDGGWGSDTQNDSPSSNQLMPPIELGQDETALLYLESPRAYREVPGWSRVAKLCLGVARRHQCPAREFSILGLDSIRLLHWHALQHLIPQDQLVEYLERALVDAVSELGVNVNEVALSALATAPVAANSLTTAAVFSPLPLPRMIGSTPNLASASEVSEGEGGKEPFYGGEGAIAMFQYVPGMGPRKVAALIKRMRLQARSAGGGTPSALQRLQRLRTRPGSRQRSMSSRRRRRRAQDSEDWDEEDEDDYDEDDYSSQFHPSRQGNTPSGADREPIPDPDTEDEEITREKEEEEERLEGSGLIIPSLRSRTDLITLKLMGKWVFMNAAPFLRLRGGVDVLDATRIHPADYELARKMAANARDEEEADPGALHPSDIVRALQDRGETGRLNELNLKDYADMLEARFHQPKRAILEAIKVELQVPYRDHRSAWTPLGPSQAFSLLSRTTDATLHPGVVALIRVTGTRDAPDGGRIVHGVLESGLDVVVRPELQPPPQGGGMERTGIYTPGQMVRGVVTNILKERFLVEASFRPEDVASAINLAARGLHVDPAFDREAEERDTRRRAAARHRAKVRQQQRRRVLNHPLFRQASTNEAESYLADKAPGDCVIRGSSRGTDHIAVTWKVAQGIYEHLDVVEKDKPNEYSMGQRLLVGSFEYADLDDLVVNHVEAMSKLVNELAKHPRCVSTPSLDALHTVLNNRVMAQEGRVAYGFCLNSERAGTFYLSWKYKLGSDPVDWVVKVNPGGYILNKLQYPSVGKLLEGFKKQGEELRRKSMQRSAAAAAASATAAAPSSRSMAAPSSRSMAAPPSRSMAAPPPRSMAAPPPPPPPHHMVPPQHAAGSRMGPGGYQPPPTASFAASQHGGPPPGRGGVTGSNGVPLSNLGHPGRGAGAPHGMGYGMAPPPPPPPSASFGIEGGGMGRGGPGGMMPPPPASSVLSQQQTGPSRGPSHPSFHHPPPGRR